MPDAPADFLAALRRRDPLRADGETDALRLLDGAGDGARFAGLVIDDFAGRWLVQTTGLPPPAFLRDLPAGPAAPRAIYWKRLDSRDQHQQPPVPWAGETITAPFTIREHGLLYRVDFQGGYSQGIFLDQRANRLALRRRTSPGASVLNCFAYTCAFSVAAAAGGALTTSVDLSRRSLDRGRENFRLNGLDPAAGHAFVAGDAFAHLRRFGRQGRRFDTILLDPPTFSRDRRGAVFRARDDFGALAALAAGLLVPGGAVFCCSNARTLTAAGFRRLILCALPAPADRWQLEPPVVPPDFTGDPPWQACWVRRARL